MTKPVDLLEYPQVESPAVSGRSKSGDAAAVASYSKGYGNIALVNCEGDNCGWSMSRFMSIG